MPFCCRVWWWWCAVIAVAFDLIDGIFSPFAYDSHPFCFFFWCSSSFYCNFFSYFTATWFFPRSFVCSFVRSLAFNILACLPLTGLFVRRNFKHNIYNIKHGVWARMCLCFFLHPTILVAERLLLAFVCFAVLRLFFRFRSFCLAYECVNVWEPEMVFALFFGSISKLWIIAHKIICFRVWYMVTQLLNSLVHIYVQPIQMRTVIFASYA